MALDEQDQPRLAATSKMRRTENGDIDILHAVGGARGIIEALLPGVLFLASFLVTQNLVLSLILTGALALAFSLVRLAQKGSLVQSLSGLVGLAICAIAALRTGNASEFFVPGLWLNAIYAVALILTVIFRVPALGFVYSLLRQEEQTWRQSPRRHRAYSLATSLLIGMFLLRLAVQVPLYFADNVTGLGIARLLMGTPLYALVLWATWMVSRPAEAIAAETF